MNVQLPLKQAKHLKKILNYLDNWRKIVALPKPVERQREVVYLAGTGHNVVLGTAGSGKTSMAILRAAYLSDPRRNGHGRTLLITFNKTLGTYIRFLADNILGRVSVENFHLFARGYLASRNLLPNGCLLSPKRRSDMISSAVTEVISIQGRNALLDRPISFFESEIKWIGQHAIPDLSTYDSVERTGRAEARMLKAQRPDMWRVYEAYLSIRKNANFLYDFDDIACAVEAALDGDNSERRYKHVVIDEGQDLSPAMLRALAKTVPTDGSLTFFGDVAQQIYGQRVTWRSAGLRPNKVWNFEENYRNTREISELALAISRMPYYVGLADLVAPRKPSAAGPKPTLIEFQNEKDEVDFVVRQATALGKGRNVAVLARTQDLVKKIVSRLPDTTQKLNKDLTSWSGGVRVSCGTLHSGKGLEFDVVILPFMSDLYFPNPIAIEVDGLDDATVSDGRLLYVGVTRARLELIITYTGRPTTLLPNNPSLYTEVKR